MHEQTKVGRHPLEAKAVGVLQNGKFKINIFSIRWSDHNDIVIYRAFEDFKKMHRELRKRLPLESGLLHKSENMIPKLRDVPIFRMNRSSSRIIQRLRLLERYSQELLKTDNKISQCEIVMAFFTPTNKDLKADFPENSMVILPTELREPQKTEVSRQLPQPPASEPIVSQMYVCIEDYETKDTKNRPFKVKHNEQLGVLIKESSGWWLVENEEKRVAWFPAPFLKTVEKEEDADSRTESEDEGVRYYTTTSYDAMSCDELSISRGILVEVREKSNDGWWLIRYNGKTGFVPAMYLKPYRNCHQLETMMTQGTSMANLFKASSSLEMNRPEELGSQDDSILALRNPDRGSKVTLDRRKSRSISGFPLNTQYGFQHPPINSTQRDKVVAPSSGPAMRPKLPKIEAIGVSPLASKATEEPPTPRPRKISVEAIVMESSPSRTMEATGHPKSHLGSDITPQVPQRPRQHEILSKCTTVTKKALKKRAMAPMHG